MPERVYDKINYQTNFTSTSTFAVLLRAIKNHGNVDSDYARATLFPQARSNSGMRYDPTIRDTHGEISLAQYGLIDYIDEKTFKLSALGNRFLELFNEDTYPQPKENNEYNYVSTMIDAMFSWKDNKYGRNINVGVLLFKLLLENDLSYYITAEEWSYIAEFSGVMTNDDYKEVKQGLITNREENVTYPLKKADVFLGGLAGTWKLLDKSNNGTTDIYKLTELARKLIIDKLKQIDYLQDFEKISNEDNEPANAVVDESKRLPGGENIILYGVPGAGKSWTVKNYYCDNKTVMERVVFHPDFTYSDFIGQIMPKSVDGDVTYEFIPGPFTKIVKESYWHPEVKYILVIEEINRGNAPAIFGDIFQLLDRNKNGASEYHITNAEIAKEVFGRENDDVYLPSNLSIICTMNTSDQNVFTLDTAFQRRWNMRLIENTFKKDTVEETKFAEQKILDTSISWEDFCNAINTQILDKNQNMTSSEDKRLGTHFVNLEDLIFIDVSTAKDDKEKKEFELKNRRFPEKVIKYLWDDAFKFYRDEIFKENLNSLEKVIKEFTTAEKDARFDIFKDVIKAALFEEAKKSKSVN